MKRSKLQSKDGSQLSWIVISVFILGTAVSGYAAEATPSESSKASDCKLHGFVQGTGEVVSGTLKGGSEILDGFGEGAGAVFSGFGNGVEKSVNGFSEGVGNLVRGGKAASDESTPS